MINPYAETNWQTDHQIVSISHAHSEAQNQFSHLVAGGVQHYAISNYYPSSPTYPLTEFFDNIPDGVLASPNAEHHSSSVDGTTIHVFHFNSLGSTFSSGKPRGETPIGLDGLDWRIAFDEILNDLQYEDGGGITLNHPSWSAAQTYIMRINLFNWFCRFLDHDQRVLGLEIFNTAKETESGESMEVNLKLWDDILSTGRRCWGFCVPDHEGQTRDNWEGRNILLVPNFTEHECLKAYRDGRFYGKLANTNLAFQSIYLSPSNILTVDTENADTINIISNGKNVYTGSGNHAVYKANNSTKYIRVEAHTSSDSIFSQPIMFSKKKGSMMKNIIRWT